MFSLLMEWLLIMFAMYGKYVAEPRWWTVVCNTAKLILLTDCIKL